MRCPHCKGNGRYKNIYGDFTTCSLCAGTGNIRFDENDKIVPIGKRKKLKNGDRLRRMNDRELAKFLSCLCVNAEMQNPIPKKTKYTVEFFENWLRSTKR